MRKAYFGLVLAVLVTLLAGTLACSAKTTTTAAPTTSVKPTTAAPTTSAAAPATSAPPTTTAAKKISVLMGAGPATWQSYAVMVATSDLVNRNSNLDITVRSHGGALEIVQGLIDKQTIIAGGPKDGSWAMAYGAFADFEGKKPAKDLRAMITSMFFIETMFAPAKTGIKTVPDLKGKKLPQFTAESNVLRDAILQAFGLDPAKDIINVPIPGSGSVGDPMRMGQIDAAEGNPVAPYVIELSSAVGPINILPITQDKLDLMRKAYPKEFNGVYIANINPGYAAHLSLAGPTPVPMSTVPITTRADAPDELVYAYVKAWLSNLQTVATLNASLKGYNVDIVQSVSSIPYHPAAIKALKEAGMWTDQMEKVNQAALAN